MMELTATGAGAEKDVAAFDPYGVSPGQALEKWGKRQSFLAGIVSRAGSGAAIAIASTVAYSVGNTLVASFLLPLTDQLLVLVAFMLCVLLAIKMVRDAVAVVVDRWVAANNGSSWIDFLINTFDFLFLVTFFATLTLGLTAATALFGVTTLHMAVAAVAGALLGLLLVLFLGHRIFGLLAHLDTLSADWATLGSDRPTAVTATAKPTAAATAAAAAVRWRGAGDRRYDTARLL